MLTRQKLGMTGSGRTSNVADANISIRVLAIVRAGLTKTGRLDEMLTPVTFICSTTAFY